MTEARTGWVLEGTKGRSLAKTVRGAVISGAVRGRASLADRGATNTRPKVGAYEMRGPAKHMSS